MARLQVREFIGKLVLLKFSFDWPRTCIPRLGDNVPTPADVERQEKKVRGVYDEELSWSQI